MALLFLPLLQSTEIIAVLLYQLFVHLGFFVVGLYAMNDVDSGGRTLWTWRLWREPSGSCAAAWLSLPFLESKPLQWMGTVCVQTRIQKRLMLHTS